MIAEAFAGYKRHEPELGIKGGETGIVSYLQHCSGKQHIELFHANIRFVAGPLLL
jgi:hypothetical protein